MTRWSIFILAMCGFLDPGALWADVSAPSGKTIECYCTDKGGSRVELGQVICLAVDGRMFMARCEMSLNSPMWRDIGSPCLSSGLEHSPEGIEALFQLSNQRAQAS